MNAHRDDDEDDDVFELYFWWLSATWLHFRFDPSNKLILIWLWQNKKTSLTQIQCWLSAEADDWNWTENMCTLGMQWKDGVMIWSKACDSFRLLIICFLPVAIYVYQNFWHSENSKAKLFGHNFEIFLTFRLYFLAMSHWTMATAPQRIYRLYFLHCCNDHHDCAFVRTQFQYYADQLFDHQARYFDINFHVQWNTNQPLYIAKEAHCLHKHS